MIADTAIVMGIPILLAVIACATIGRKWSDGAKCWLGYGCGLVGAAVGFWITIAG